MIKLEQECPWMASAVFCFHRINCPAWETLVGKSQLLYRNSGLCLLFPCTQPQITLKSPIPCEVVPLWMWQWMPLWSVHPLRNHDAGFFQPWVSHFFWYIPYPVQCLNSSAEADKSGRLTKAVQEELIRVVIDHGGWDALGEANGAHLCSKAWWHLSVLFSPLCWLLSSLVPGGAKHSDHQEPSVLLLPEALSITTPSSLGMSHEAGSQI